MLLHRAKPVAEARPGRSALAPGRIDPALEERTGERFGVAAADRGRRPRLAHDLGRHALCDLRQATTVDHQRQDGVALDVDEPGADDVPCRVDDVARRLERNGAGRFDRSDPVAGHRHVAVLPGVAGAVDDAGVADEGVERGHWASGESIARTRGLW